MKFKFMTLVKCKKCGHMISDRTKYCPYCGFKQENVCNENGTTSNQEEQADDVTDQIITHSNKTLIIMTILVIAVIVGFTVFSVFSKKNNEIVNPPIKDTVTVDTIKPIEEKPMEVIASQFAIGTIKKGMLAKVAVPMLTNPSAKGDFYDRVEIEATDRNITEVCYEVVLYKGKEKLCSFTTDAQYDLSNEDGVPSKKDMGNGHITYFSIYSPSIKLQDGIHVGLTAKELVEKYHAKIRHFENFEYGGLEFVFNEYPEGYSFIAKGKIINSNIGDDIDDSEEEFLTLSDVKDCSLKQIDF